MSEKEPRKSILKPILGALAVVALLTVAAIYDVVGALKDLLVWIDGLGVLGYVIFILAYILATVLLLPGFILTVGGGFVFGALKGSILASVASTLGATAAMLVGRYLARDWVGHKIAGNTSFLAIDKAIAREGWKIVGLIRLSPLIPFNLLNYALGLTRVKVQHYLLASWIGMMPGTVVYVYLGSLAGDLATLGARAERSPLEWTLYIVGLVATVAVTVYVTRVAKRALEEKVS